MFKEHESVLARRASYGLAVIALFVLAWLPQAAQATFPGVNGKIALSALDENDGYYEIFTINADGTGIGELTHDIGGDFWPAWSADGAKIAFTSYRDGNYEIYTMSADGTGIARVTDDPAADGEPAWSPDGSKIAFASNRDGDFEIYSVRLDGTDLTQLTQNTTDDHNPDWSPDGTKIAFDGERDGDRDVAAVDVEDPSVKANLTTGSVATDAYPSWSPDGEKIAFATDREGDFEVYTIDADGGNAANVTHHPGAMDLDPAWSPDATEIAFAGAGEGWEILLASAYGAGDANAITDGIVADAGAPAWQPVAPAGDVTQTTQPVSQLATGPATPATDINTADTTAPAISSLRVNHTKIKMRTLRSKPSKAVYFKFKLTEDASVKAKLYRRKKHSSKYTYLGSLTKSEKSGVDKLKVSTSLAKKLRRYARYKATLQATDAAGNRSKSRSVTFKVVSR